jgi:hypothetical protein
MTSIKEKIESAATDQELLTTSQEIEQKFDKKKITTTASLHLQQHYSIGKRSPED